MKTTTSGITALFVLGWGCLLHAAPDYKLVGFGAISGEGGSSTSGGAGGKVVTVSNLAELEAWALSREKNTAAEILRINGKISASGGALMTIKNGANITIEGVGTAGELLNIGLNIRDYNNVIIRNLTIHEVEYPNDAITLDNVQNGWVSQCELYSKIGEGIGQDTYDGLLDIKKGSSNITISWNYLHHHMKCSLIGHSDSEGNQEADSKIRVTYHHNWFSHTDGRNPSLRFGAVHLFNNVFENITDYGIAARDGAHAKVENNVYMNVKLPMSTDKFPVEGLPNGYICESGNVIGGTSGENVISQTGCNWWNNSTLPYAYTVDAISTVEAEVRQNAGRGGNVVVGIRPGVSRKNWNPILTWKAGNGKVSYIASRRNSSVRVDLSGKMQRAQ
jgi:pectate lyase